MSGYKKTGYHDPVLLQEVLESIPSDAKVIMDGTLGHGGHTAAIAKKFKSSPCHPELDSGSNDKQSIRHAPSLDSGSSPEGQKVKIVGVDKDPQMLAKAKERLKDYSNIIFVNRTYAELEQIIQDSGVSGFDYILLDIGVNMDHFKVADRGFSIRLDGPLDMRFDQTQGQPVSQWLQTCKYQDIVDLIEAETDFSSSLRERISKELLVAKRKHQFTTTGQFVDRAKSAGLGEKKITILFQALRILVNNELKELDTFLQSFVSYLNPGGICGVMSYHSGEDRRVKIAFKALAQQGEGTLVNKKVIKPTRQEAKKNKAARSAKYRLFQKTS